MRRRASSAASTMRVRESRSSASACLRSVMSRRYPVNVGGPGTSMRVIVSSTGNSLPSERIPVISTRRSSTGPLPVTR